MTHCSGAHTPLTHCAAAQATATPIDLLRPTAFLRHCCHLVSHGTKKTLHFATPWSPFGQVYEYEQ